MSQDSEEFMDSVLVQAKLAPEDFERIMDLQASITHLPSTGRHKEIRLCPGSFWQVFMEEENAM